MKVRNWENYSQEMFMILSPEHRSFRSQVQCRAQNWREEAIFPACSGNVILLWQLKGWLTWQHWERLWTWHHQCWFHDGQRQYWCFPSGPAGSRPGGARAEEKGPGGPVWFQQLVCKHEWHILLGTPRKSCRTLKSSWDPVVTFVIWTSKGNITWFYTVWETWTGCNGTVIAINRLLYKELNFME